MKKLGTGGDVKYSYGGKDQANKQRTRFGSSFGYKLNAPDANNDRYAGLKEGGKVMKTESKKEMREELKIDTAQDKKLIKKAISMHDKQEHKGGKGTNLSKLCSGGKVKKMAKGGGCEVKGKTKGRMV